LLWVVGVCLLSADGRWRGRSVNVDEKGCQDESLPGAILEVSQPTPFAASGGKCEAAITNQLHDQADYEPVR